MNNQHLRFTKDKFIVTTDPSFFQLEAIHDHLSQSSWLLVLMLKRSGYQSRTAFVSRSWMEQDKSASPVWSQTMPLLVICVTSTC